MDLVMPTSSPTSSMICHQRALSLPQNSNNVIINNQNAQSSATGIKSININNSKTFAIQPVHHRTRSLPLTEETAIDFTSQSPPNFMKFTTSISPSTSSSSSGVVVIESKPNNNSMESIIEDYQNMDVVNNNSSSYRSNNNGGSSSILKQLSKIANSNLVSHKSSASSPSQLRKKRQHHNVMTASLRSMYHVNYLIANTTAILSLNKNKYIKIYIYKLL